MRQRRRAPEGGRDISSSRWDTWRRHKALPVGMLPAPSLARAAGVARRAQTWEYVLLTRQPVVYWLSRARGTRHTCWKLPARVSTCPWVIGPHRPYQGETRSGSSQLSTPTGTPRTIAWRIGESSRGAHGRYGRRGRNESGTFRSEAGNLVARQRLRKASSALQK